MGRASPTPCSTWGVWPPRKATTGAPKLFSPKVCESAGSSGRKWDVAGVLEELARSASRQRCWERALRLAGAATALRERIGAPLAPTEKVRFDADLDPARKGLPGAEATTAWMRGWATSPDEAIEYGLENQ